MKTIKLLTIWVVCVLASLVALLGMLYAIFSNPTKAWRISVATDRQANAVFNGSDKETISSRAYRGMTQGNKGWCVLCKILNLLDKDHCEKAKDI